MPVTTNDLTQLATRAELVSLERRMTENFEKILDMIRPIHQKILMTQGSGLEGKEKKFFSPAEFAQIIGVSKNTVIRRCQDGTYKSTQPGGHGTAIHIPREEVERLTKKAEKLE